MSSEVLPLTTLAKQLEYCQGSQFQLILKKLTSPAYIDEQFLKSDLPLVATKIQKLLRSNQDYDIWKGCHASVVICSYNPLALCVHGGQLLTVIYSRLEQKKEYHSVSSETFSEKIVLKSLTFALSTLMDLMRGKPTLSRESLVPKLKAIIPCLIDLTAVEPELCLPILKELLQKNSTTFRPYANKYRQVLSTLISQEYGNLDANVQSLVCENYAYLHLIKLQAQNLQDEHQAHHKSFHDETWRIGILSILAQFKPILELCDEILDLDHDQDLKKLIKGLQYDNLYPADLPTSDKLLPGLKIDLNEPMTLWQIPQRLNLLIDLLSPFLSLPTPYPVRIPLGACISVFEGLLGMTRNYIPLRREIRRDAELVSVIYDVLSHVQFSGVRLLNILVQNFGKCCLSMLPSILGSLEFFIPLQLKSKSIDIRRCKLMKSEFLHYFQLLNSIFSNIGYQLQELDFFQKLVEVALALSEDESLANLLTNEAPAKNQANKVGKKQKKDNSVGALSDMYTHADQFTLKTSLEWYDEVNLFLCGLLSNFKLPSSQQVKIIRYGVQTSLNWEQQVGRIPESFVKLLRAIVINPGNERVSILPIAASLLKGSSDEVFDLLCHPRLPVNMVHNFKGLSSSIEEQSQGELPSNEDLEEAEDEHDEEEKPEGEDGAKNDSNTKRQIPETDSEPEPPKRQKLDENVPVFQPQNTEILKGKMEPSRSLEKKNGMAVVQETQAAPAQEEPSESESEMVIPQIHLSDDDEE
ncbi:hypothetical protein ZYGR_0AG03590 [Zygosaccharomyces rouxii]|uniref:Pre-rRNA-processing protein RIX1 n=1 Tax=Zygosaccharomyces rouxii TaxID=4956 RepID=A0A1Q3A9Q2_ZYGRO|nr:hypothetical protein ZYGR_0AG03590 [Zygosaccharomyces rouxii]